MKKYRKKPVIIEAERWWKLGDVPEANITQYRVLSDAICSRCKRRFDEHGWCETLEGGHTVCPGDWIIKGVKGEYYPCKPDVFKATYEPVDNEKTQDVMNLLKTVYKAFSEFDEAIRQRPMDALTVRIAYIKLDAVMQDIYEAINDPTIKKLPTLRLKRKEEK